MLSPDTDFSPAGANSGIQYSESFKKYKELLTEDPESSMYQRIFSKFKDSLFGKESDSDDKVVVDDGDYASELAQFKEGLIADSIAEGVTDAGVDETSPLPPPASPPLQLDHEVSISVANPGANKASPLPSPPTPPLQPDRVSISVTSHISHTITASAQVSNIVNSSLTLSPEHEVKEIPPIQEKSRPAPRKKATKPPKPTAATSDTNADVAPIRRVTRQTKPASADPLPDRTTRKR